MTEEQGGNNVPHSNGKEERIYVAIRVRPLNEKEKTRQDVSEWECVSHNTIRFRNNGHAEQRSSPDAYTFDRVFGEKCPTKQVYEQGIKEVALSVIRGINSSIFAYGQTSSGKTYTMTGITELAVRDIYEHIEKHKEREFIVKFSALEIYNEAVRDLLNSNATTLRILDDPEKGTIVEKLTEETLTERSQLQQLISKCAAERTTEDTAMNETSSRSHQILRLSVESNPSDFVGTARSGALFASVNFVDLAGSERASQALSAGTRLREGSHINRSLLTLGTVIRKLSKERNGHIPYRDSKLTRILHNSLGGNARTAIICTISPARSQVEQSKNTLFFAGCAKQVTTNARVNAVISDKVLVKQLQKELARMENELKSLNTIILKERENQIEQKDKEIKELTRQRDLFQNLLHSVGKDQVLRVDQDWASEWSSVANDSSPVTDIISEDLDRTTSSSSISNEHLFKQPENFEDNFLLDGCPPTFVGPDPCQGWEEMASRSESEDNCKEVPCIEIKEVETKHKTDINMSIPAFKESQGNSIPAFEESEGNPPVIQFVDVDGNSSLGNEHCDQDAPQQKTEGIKRTNKHLVNLLEKSNDSFESEPRCMAAMSPPEVDGKSSIRNGHSDQDAPQQKIEDIKRTNDHVVNLYEKFNDSFESEPRCMAAMSPPQVDGKSSIGNGYSDQDDPQQKIEDFKKINDHLVNLSEKSNDSFGSEPRCMAALSPPQVDSKSSIGNGHSDQDAPQQKSIKRTDDHLVNLSEKSNDSFESEPRCIAAISLPQVDGKSSIGNGHSDQDVPEQKTEDIKRTNDHLVNLSEKSNDSFESEPCCMAAMSPPHVDGKSSIRNGHRDQDAPQQKTEDIKRTNDHLVNLSEKFNDLLESKSRCMAAMYPPQVDGKSSIGNGHSDQGAPQQKIEDIKRTNDHPVNLSRKSNDSFESKPRCMAPQVFKVDQENSPHHQFLNLEKNVSPHSSNKLDQEPTSPHQFDQEDLKTMSPPQLDLEQVSFKSPAGVEKEYSTSLVCFPEKLSEPKLRAKRRKPSKKSSVIHEKNASLEDAESVMDSDTEETSSVLNYVVRMNESLKPKPVDRDIDNLMEPGRTPPFNINVNRVRGLSFPGVWGGLIPSKFEMQQRDIVELWDACNVPLVHRSYFFLLIKGELSDSVYLDVELRRLSFLKDTFSSGNHITGVEGLDVTPNSSLMSLTRERKMLSKQVHKKFSRKGREELYLKWGIDLKTKHRSIQLAWLIWTDTRDLNHIRESAALVAKLVGFINTGETSKKTFGFGFLTRRKSRESLSWKDTMSTL